VFCRPEAIHLKALANEQMEGIVMDDKLERPASRVCWLVGLALGVGTHIAFAITVGDLFRFLRLGTGYVAENWATHDLLLSLQFAGIHSLLLYPQVRNCLTRVIPREWYGLFFCAVTCVCLNWIFMSWRESDRILWQLEGVGETIMLCGFYLSWILLGHSLWISGPGYQTGLTPWWYWLRNRRPPRRGLVTTSWYRYFRHPIYLSFLGLIWFNPRMTWDHGLLTLVWTIYIFVGSYLKDERLAFHLGATYREYQRSVPGYPFLYWGPLGPYRSRRSEADVSASGKPVAPRTT
jgi:hypothetical protein